MIQGVAAPAKNGEGTGASIMCMTSGGHKVDVGGDTCETLGTHMRVPTRVASNTLVSCEQSE